MIVSPVMALTNHSSRTRAAERFKWPPFPRRESMNRPDHNVLLASAASAALLPLGCTRKGRSRTWLDDHEWWVGVVEFQPSAWSKGSYLNVGVRWLWYENDHFSFDTALGAHGSRVEAFHEFDDTDAFEQSARVLAQRARTEVLALRDQMSSLRRTSEFLESRRLEDSVWGSYHAGVAAGLVGDSGAATAHFAKVLAEKSDFNWVRQLKGRTTALLESVEDTARFRLAIDSVVRRTRARLKLPIIGKPILFEC